MGTSGTFEIEGFAELDDKLRALPDNVAKRATIRAVKRASDLMAEAQRRRAPRGPTGNLRDSIRVTAKSRNLTGMAEYSAVLQSGGTHGAAQSAMREARRGNDSAGTRIFVLIGSTSPHAHLVEFGTGPRHHEKTGKFTGVMPAHPFIRPAFDETKGQVIAAFKSELAMEIQRTDARLARRAAKGG